MKTEIIIYLIKTYKISQPGMRLQVMARERGKGGVLHKWGSVCYRYNAGRVLGALLQVDFLALAQGPPCVGHCQVVLQCLLADHWLVAEKVVLGGGKGGRGCVRGIVHQVALNHCFRCLALEHLKMVEIEHFVVWFGVDVSEDKIFLICPPEPQDMHGHSSSCRSWLDCNV